MRREKAFFREVVLTILAFTACDGGECLTGKGNNVQIQPESHPKEDPKEVVDTIETLLVTAIVYPEGYDWQGNPGDDSVPCSLVLMELREEGDSILVQRSVGPEHCVSAAPDMHRIVDGHLYDDWPTDSETLIRKDGEEILRIDARETIVDMRLKDGELHTLGTGRDGGGFVLRKDGAIFEKSANILPVGGFREDGDDIYFSGVVITEGSGWQWYAVKDGTAIAVTPTDRKQAILEVALADGRPCYACDSGKGLLVHFNGEDIQVTTNLRNTGFSVGSMSYHDGTLLVPFVMTNRGTPVRLYIWSSSAGYIHIEGKYRLKASAAENGDMRVLALDEDTGLYTIFGLSGEEGVRFLPEEMTPAATRAMMLHDGVLHLSLTDRRGRAMLWSDGKIRDLGLNGYVDHISIRTEYRSRLSYSR